MTLFFTGNTVNSAGSIQIPYVTAKQKLWSGVRSDVYGSTVDGSLVLPSNYPNEYQDPPYSSASTFNDIIVLAPNDDDPADVLGRAMIDGGNRFSNVKYMRPIVIYGRGLNVQIIR